MKYKRRKKNVLKKTDKQTKKSTGDFAKFDFYSKLDEMGKC